MKTRTKVAVKGTAETRETQKDATPATPRVQLGPDSDRPPNLFVLPKDVSEGARFVSLVNARYSSLNRYFVCPEKGFHELTRVAAPKTTPRSWLLTPSDSPSEEPNVEGDDEEASKGYVSRSADLIVVTPIDPLFIILSVLAPSPTKIAKPEPVKRLFLSGDDYLDKLVAVSPQMASLLRAQALRKRLEKRMATVCETVDAGDETMYRLNEEKLLDVLLQKARKMVENGLIPSMEEKLVKRALEVPLLSIKRGETSTQEGVEEDTTPDPNSTSDKENADSQTSIAPTLTPADSFAEASTAATSFSEETAFPKEAEDKSQAPEGIADLLRLRTAFSFICSKYLAPHLTQILQTALASPSSTLDFSSLDKHLAHLATLRQSALAARSLNDFSRKRGFEDEDCSESRLEKKRKLEEEEKKKKAGESRGIKNLKKANITGMKKMSDFFKKK